MCVILAVQHPCTHNTAVWQHCINASKSTAQGTRPCNQIRHHPRPIVTRKRCINCIFARRGGLAEREVASLIVEKEERPNDDSGYHSGTIAEEEEEDEDYESDISPKTARRRQSIWYMQDSDKELEVQLSESTPKVTYSPKRRKSSAQDPQREVNVDSISVLQRSLFDLQTLSTKTRNARSGISQWSTLDSRASTVPAPLNPTVRLQRPVLPPLKTEFTLSAPRRKPSSLLHPSTPPAEKAAQQAHASPFPRASKAKANIPVIILTSPPKTIQRPPMHRKRSTLLHPSTPPGTAPNHTHAEDFPFSIRRPPPITLKLSIPGSKERKQSIIHSSFSDSEDELYDEDETETETEDENYDELFSGSIYSVTTNDEIGLAESARMMQAKRISQLVME